MSTSLVISEIYQSVQGEAAYAGWPCTFVRLTGCPLRCRWCDTVYGFKGGNTMEFAAIKEQIRAFGIPLVEMTGGEPLAQTESVAFMKELVDEGYKVMIETSGSESVENLAPEIHIIMDLKCPGSGMEARNHYANLQWLKPTDEIKFVIADRDDYEWARNLVRMEQLDTRFNVLFSTAFGLLMPQKLVEWILEDRMMRVRLNLQQHKYIWKPTAKGV
ncbi:MAG: radical SAM protein [Chitinophagaceae bacterium]|nr:radical SAM protein [Oligoflexus sp.]